MHLSDNMKNIQLLGIYRRNCSNKKVNNMILALNDDSTKKQIKEARDAYEALDETHKAIFNKDTLRKLLAAETGSGNSIEKLWQPLMRFRQRIS